MTKPSVQTHQFNVRLDSSLIEALTVIKDRDGIPFSQQITRAVRLWVKEKGVTVPMPSRPRRTHVA
jgi:hypothetical protein